MSSRLLAVTFLPSPAKTHDPRMTTCRERDATTPRSLVRKRDTLLVRTCCCCSSSSSPTAGLTRTGENNTIHPIAKIPPCLCALALSLVKSKSSQVGRKKNRIFRLFASSELLNRGRVRRCKVRPSVCHRDWVPSDRSWRGISGINFLSRLLLL